MLRRDLSPHGANDNKIPPFAAAQIRRRFIVCHYGRGPMPFPVSFIQDDIASNAPSPFRFTRTRDRIEPLVNLILVDLMSSALVPANLLLDNLLNWVLFW